MYIKFSSVSTIQSNASIHISTIDFCLIDLHICLFYACETFLHYIHNILIISI